MARFVKSAMAEKGLTQKELATRSGEPEARISRILKCGNVRLTEQDINQLAIGLHKSKAWRDQLRYLAWPELKYVDEALEHGKDIFDLNRRLTDVGIPYLGNACPE